MAISTHLEDTLTARILVIEDNPNNLELLVYLLEAFGHQVHAAKEGSEGIEQFHREKPDLVLVDIHMPRIDGYEVLKRLRSNNQSEGIPIVAVTALAMVGDRERLLSSGFDGYISKPLDPENFVNKVQEFLHGKPSEPRRNSPNHPPASNAVVARQPKRGVFLIVDNSPVNLELARSILAPHGYEVVTANSVEEGVQLARKHKPNLIISDVHMPHHDGYYFIDLLHSDSELRHIPFVFLSSSCSSLYEHEMAQVHGAVKLLNRPIDPQCLVIELESCLRSR
ncbi:MAG TPA: response regulator [Terriglobales bacterium]|nr:response regulator [Terriglobales bacterium]